LTAEAERLASRTVKNNKQEQINPEQNLISGFFRKFHLPLFIIFFSIFFWLIALPGARTSGIDGDEAKHAHMAMNLADGTDLPLYYGYKVRIFGRDITYTVLSDYEIGLHSLLLVPVFYLFGSGVFSVKLFSVFISWAFLLLLFLLLRKYLNFFIGALTVILTALSPVFIHAVRIGFFHQEILINLLLLLSAAFMIIYRKNGKTLFFWAAAFTAGLSLNTKLSVTARFFGVAAATLFLYRGVVWKWVSGEKKMRIALAAVFFAAGSFLFIHSNLVRGGGSFKLAHSVFIRGEDTYAGRRAGEYLSNLSLRFSQMVDMIRENSYDMTTDTMVLRLKTGRTLALFLTGGFFLSFAVNPLVVFFRWDKKKKRVFYFINITYLLMFLLSAISPGSLRRAHMYILFPFFQFTVAVFIYNLGKYSGKTGVMLALGIAAAIPYTAELRRYLKEHNESGGAIIGSPATDDFIRYLKANEPNPIFTLCHSTLAHDSIPFLTGGFTPQVNQALAFYILELERRREPFNSTGYINIIHKEFRYIDKAYILDNIHTSRHPLPEVRELVFNTLKETGFEVKTRKTFRDNSGNPLYGLTKIYREKT